MKKNEEIILNIDYVAFPNKGVGHYEDKKVVVKNTLPGQCVKAKIKKNKDNLSEGELVEVIKSSPIETENKCSHFGICGGCVYQGISHDSEMEIKEKQVLDLFKNAGIEGFKYEGIESPDDFLYYRNKCEFSFGDDKKDGELALGMRKRRSYYEVVTLKDCNIVDADYLKIIECTLEFFKSRNIPFYHKSRHDGTLRHLVVRKGAYTGEILINLVTTSSYSFNVDEYKESLLFTELKGKICGIIHTTNDGVADVIKVDGINVVYGRDYLNEKLFGLKFKVGAFSFFQTNTKGAEVLYSVVKDFVGDSKNKVVFDLYCGTGTISQIIASECSHVYGIEIVDEAVSAAIENAKENGIQNCTFIAGDVLKKVDELTVKPDIIIVDPPREGIHPKAITKIIDFGAPEIVYVSCKPTSLVRDLKIFIDSGYNVERVKIVNQFERTTHVETIALIKK